MTDPSDDQRNGLEAFRHEDYEAARRLLLPVAQAGDAEAQCIIGNMYECGLGMPRDEIEAARWYEISSAQGYGVASNNLGGIAVRRGNLADAKKWYDMAEAQGFIGISPDERRRLGCL